MHLGLRKCVTSIRASVTPPNTTHTETLAKHNVKRVLKSVKVIELVIKLRFTFTCYFESVMGFVLSRKWSLK